MSKKKIIISSHSGFCFGVRRALDIAKSALRDGKTVYSLGAIIHNPQVVGEFSEKGLKIVGNVGKVKGKAPTVLIPSHGASPDILKKTNIKLIDTTCPLVGRVQKIVKSLKDKGYFIIIVGDKKHPEVKGLKGIARVSCCVIRDKGEARALKLKSKKVALISQTTSSLAAFKSILSEIAKKDFIELASHNTVCRNTVDRQKEARAIAGRVDAMIVIGGKQSANTTRLAKACKEVNRNTYHVESAEDLNMRCLKNKKSVGIATGASTPPYAIDEVVKKIRRMG
ncbi:4-hydroxy-3-methylbut-2-enyl diphosphate reductase [Candidatus Omnitrophota bacterium]